MSFWKILFTLAECCFGWNVIEDQTFEKITTKPMRWMNENINLRCIFFLICL